MERQHTRIKSQRNPLFTPVLTPARAAFQAVDQLVQCMTDDQYKGKMVVIVAGYVHDIDALMEANPGLASRFPETLHFPNFGLGDCCRLFESSLKREHSTEIAADAAAALRQLLPPIVEVRHAFEARREI